MGKVLEELMDEMERTRKQLNYYARTEGVSADQTFKLSLKLDRLIERYIKLKEENSTFI